MMIENISSKLKKYMLYLGVGFFKGVHKLYDILLLSLIIVSLLLIVVVLMQPSKTNAASALSGGAEQLFGKQKARGFEAGLRRVTGVLGFAFMGLALALAYLTSH